jgi:hypothetical protein
MHSFNSSTIPLYDGLKKMKEEPSHHDTRARAKFHGRMQFPDTPATREAFEKLKEALVSAPVLIHADFDLEFILYIDVCYQGVTGTLHQISTKDNQEHPILYISRRLNVHEAKYSATELECLGMVWSLDKLTHYVDGAKLRLVTDHSTLKWIWNVKSNVNARLFKWSLQLSVLKDKVTIVHRPEQFTSNCGPAKSSISSCHINPYVRRIEGQVIGRIQKRPYIPKDFASIAIPRPEK